MKKSRFTDEQIVGFLRQAEIFVPLEDETGSVNIIVLQHVRERRRTALLRSHLRRRPDSGRPRTAPRTW